MRTVSGLILVTLERSGANMKPCGSLCARIRAAEPGATIEPLKSDRYARIAAQNTKYMRCDGTCVLGRIAARCNPLPLPGQQSAVDIEDRSGNVLRRKHEFGKLPRPRGQCAVGRKIKR